MKKKLLWMIRWFPFALLVSTKSYAQEAATNTFVEVWTYTDPQAQYTDGVTTGAFWDGGRHAIFRSDTNYNIGGIQGRLVVLDNQGGVRFTSPGRLGADLIGYSLAYNFDESGPAELFYGEATEIGRVYARRSSATNPLWTSTPYGWSGMYNLGPSAGDITNIGPLDLVVPDWNGNVTVLNPSNGAILRQIDLYATLGEYISGHVAVGELIASSPGEEIVIFGADAGKVIVLGSGVGTTLDVLYESAADPMGGYAEGSGPALGDIDGDGQQEIVVVGVGTQTVYAYDVNKGTGCEYFWPVTGADYFYTSPVIGDVLPLIANNEVVVQSTNSVVEVLSAAPPPSAGICVQGTTRFTQVIGTGGDSWFTPALANVAGLSGIDIITANYTNLEIIEPQQDRVAYRFTDPTATFYSSLTVTRGSASGPANIVISGWLNSRVYRLDTRPGAPYPSGWNHAMGSPRRQGLAK